MSETKTAAPETALVQQPQTRAIASASPVAMDESGPKLESTRDVWGLAEIMATGMGLVKHQMSDPEKRVAVAKFATRIIFGREAGLSTAQAVRGIYDVNGRPAWYAETLRGLLISRGVVPADDENALQLYIENEPKPGTPRKDWPDDVAGVAKIRRVGWKTHKVSRFTVGDAKMAGLWSKPGPWQEYLKRMLQERAFGFWCRDYAPDVTMGLPLVSEARDIADSERRRELASGPEPTPDGGGKAPARDAFADLGGDGAVEIQDAEVIVPEQPAAGPPRAADETETESPLDPEAGAAALRSQIEARVEHEDRADVLRDVLPKIPATPGELAEAYARLEDHPAVRAAEAVQPGPVHAAKAPEAAGQGGLFGDTPRPQQRRDEPHHAGRKKGGRR